MIILKGKKSERDIEHIAKAFIELELTLKEVGDLMQMYQEEDRIKIVKAVSRQVR